MFKSDQGSPKNDLEERLIVPMAKKKSMITDENLQKLT
jgi:hypothetical protein